MRKLFLCLSIVLCSIFTSSCSNETYVEGGDNVFIIKDLLGKDKEGNYYYKVKLLGSSRILIEYVSTDQYRLGDTLVLIPKNKIK